MLFIQSLVRQPVSLCVLLAGHTPELDFKTTETLAIINQIIDGLVNFLQLAEMGNRFAIRLGSTTS